MVRLAKVPAQEFDRKDEFLKQDFQDVPFRMGGNAHNKHKDKRTCPERVQEWDAENDIRAFQVASETVFLLNENEGVPVLKGILGPGTRIFSSEAAIAGYLSGFNDWMIQGLKAFQSPYQPELQAMGLFSTPPGKSTSSRQADATDDVGGPSNVVLGTPVSAEKGGKSAASTVLSDMVYGKASQGPLQIEDVFLVEEVKKPQVLCSDEDAKNKKAPDMVKLWNNPCLGSNPINAVTAQAFHYMVTYEVNHCVITTGELTYLCEKVGTGMRITRGFWWSEKEFTPFTVKSYALEQSIKSKRNGEFVTWPGGNFPFPYFMDDSTTSSDATDDEDEDRQWTGQSKQDRKAEAKRKRAEGGGGGGGGDEGQQQQNRQSGGGRQMMAKIGVFLPDVHADRLGDKENSVLAVGWTGAIVRGCIDGVEVAIKSAGSSSSKAQAVVNEVAALTVLGENDVKNVAKLVEYGLVERNPSEGKQVFLATELVEGRHAGAATPTPAQAKAAMEALRGVHSVGLLHGDIRPENVMLSGTDKAVLLDFGFGQRSVDKGRQKEEVAQLKRVLGLG